MVPFCNFEMNNTAVTHIWFKFTVGGSVSERLPKAIVYRF